MRSRRCRYGMKTRIVCFGDSNTWGYDAESGGRFPDEVRWTGLLKEGLGEDCTIVEEGLCGRTTVLEDPLNEGMCGLKYLYPCLMSQAPVDWLVIMLGTNDCKERFGMTAKNIADGMKRLVLKARTVPAFRTEPKILVIAPGAIEEECETSPVGCEMGVCSGKSKELAKYYRQMAQEMGCSFLDAGETVTMNRIDYMHLDRRSHQALAARLTDFFRKEG